MGPSEGPDAATLALPEHRLAAQQAESCLLARRSASTLPEQRAEWEQTVWTAQAQRVQERSERMQWEVRE